MFRDMEHATEKLRVPDNVLTQRVNDEMMLFNLDSEVYFSLNPIGVRFLEILETEETVGRVLGALEQEYDVDVAILENDLLKFVESLKHKGLLVQI